MGSASSRELVRKIVDQLSPDPQSIQEIADKVEADRQAVTKYLEELEDAGLVKDQKKGRTRKFYISSYERKDTYFDLPLDEEDKKVLKTLFGVITRKFREENGKTPSKLEAQKMAVKVIHDTSLELPTGRYMYGSITPLNYTPGKTYPEGPLPREDKVLEAVDAAVEKYSGRETGEVMEEQYREEGMRLHQIRQEISSMIFEGTGGEELQQELYRFLSHLPELDSGAEELVVDFVAVAPDLVEGETSELVLEVFQKVWELVSLYVLHADLEENYEKEILEDRLGPKKAEKKDEATEAVSNLVDHFSKDYDLGEFEELLGSAEELSEEEKEKRSKELEDMGQSEILREYGFDR